MRVAERRGMGADLDVAAGHECAWPRAMVVLSVRLDRDALVSNGTNL